MQPPQPVCPDCGSKEVAFFCHGYVELTIVWDGASWVANPDPAAFVQGWNGDESYHQCNSCFWQCHISDLICPFEDENQD